MKRQPNGIRLEEADKVLRAYGYEGVRQKGSHKQYLNKETGDTLEELYENLNEAMEGYLEVKLENNLPIPLPERTENYSGKFNVRLPKSLHQRLAIQAEEEGVSLNQLVLYKLSL